VVTCVGSRHIYHPLPADATQYFYLISCVLSTRCGATK